MRQRHNPVYSTLEMYLEGVMQAFLTRELHGRFKQLIEDASELTFWVRAKETANNHPRFCRMCEKWSLVDTPLEEIKQDIRSALSHHFGCDDSPEILQTVIFEECEEHRLDQDLLAHVHLIVANRATIEDRHDWPASRDWSEKRITVLCSAMFWASVHE